MMGNGRNPGLRTCRHLTLSFEEQLHMEGQSSSREQGWENGSNFLCGNVTPRGLFYIRIL